MYRLSATAAEELIRAAKTLSPTPAITAIRFPGEVSLGVETYDTIAGITQVGLQIPRMKQHYVHLSPSYMAAAVNKLDGVLVGALPEPK
jgi:hypothetical protein